MNRLRPLELRGASISACLDRAEPGDGTPGVPGSLITGRATARAGLAGRSHRRGPLPCDGQ